MRVHKGRPGHFERMNLGRQKEITARRREMINAAMAGGRSGFAVQDTDGQPVLGCGHRHGWAARSTAEGALMQKPGQLQKPVKAGALRKDMPPCPGCHASPGTPHAPGCTWVVAVAQLQKQAR